MEVLISPRTFYFFTGSDLNYQEDAGGGPDLVVGYFPKLEKLSLLQVNIFVIHCFSNIYLLYTLSTLLNNLSTSTQVFKYLVDKHLTLCTYVL